MKRTLLPTHPDVLLLLTLFCEKTIAGPHAAAPSAPAETAPPPMHMNMDMMMDDQRFIGWVETGITVNFDSPEDNQNFGRLLDDRFQRALIESICAHG